MAKVGIVTQPLWGNYGGLLQNYALQTFLRRLGHEPITIDYLSRPRWYRYPLSLLKSLALYPFPSRRRKFAKWHPVRENELIDRFVTEHISKTDYVYRYKSTLVSKLHLDAIITGSDQVWRPAYNRYLADMYLDFAKGLDISRIAYAASFGTSDKEYTPDQVRECRDAARRLDAVSVREDSGITLCRDYFGIDATQVLDPTLLLTADDYCALAADIPPCKGKHIGTYILDPTPGSDRVLRETKQATGISNVVAVAENDPDIAPQHWIAMIRDASFVVTDSFHGTVFSIIFRKPFITICNRDRGADRFISLLEPLGLMDRLVYSKSNELEIIATKDIGWENVYRRLDERREHSVNFLKNSLPKSIP